jgi:hypothetical protein
MSGFTGFRIPKDNPDRGVIEYNHEIVIGATFDDDFAQASSAGGWFSALPRKKFAKALRQLANFLDGVEIDRRESTRASTCIGCIAVSGCRDYSPLRRNICAMSYEELAKRAGTTVEYATKWSEGRANDREKTLQGEI